MCCSCWIAFCHVFTFPKDIPVRYHVSRSFCVFVCSGVVSSGVSLFQMACQVLFLSFRVNKNTGYESDEYGFIE